MPRFRFVDRPASDPEWKAVHRAADRGIASIRGPFLEQVEVLRDGLPSLEALETLILHGGAAAVVGAIEWAQFEAALSRPLLQGIKDTQARAMRGVLGILEDDVPAEVELVIAKQEITARFDLVNPESVNVAARQAGEAVIEVSAATKRSIREIVRRGQLGQLTVDQQARRIRGLIGLTERQTASVLNFEAGLIERGITGTRLETMVARKYRQVLARRASTIARTETIKAANLGQRNLWRQAADQGLINRDTAQKRWIITPGDRTCPICIPMDGQLRPLEEPFVSPFNGASTQTPGIHVACLPGDALVTARGRIVAASKRWYEGDLVVIKCAGQLPLTCTPNHPVLTPHGWVQAASLDVGGEIVYPLVGEGVVGRDGQDIHMPASAEDIARAFREAPGVVSREVPVAAPDFHGDGFGSQVAIIGTDRSLRLGVDAADPQLVSDFDFDRRDVAGVEVDLTGFCAENLGAHWQGTPPGRLMGRAHPQLALPNRHLRPLEFLGGAATTWADAGLQQPAPDGVSIAAVAVGEPFLRPASEILVYDHVNRKIQSSDHVSYRGWVYNFETTESYYLTNGVATHNCRCAMALEVP